MERSAFSREEDACSLFFQHAGTMNNVPEHEHREYIPRPPESKNTTDFIVTIFVIMVASVLGILTLGAMVLALFTDDDVGPFIAIITDLMTTIISALVGFLAGRGAAKSEIYEKGGSP